MALQGTLETFSLTEVLRLLGGSSKTGLLAIEGDGGVGNVWFRDGRIVAALSDREQSADPTRVVFDLLRFTVGDFVFDPDAEPDDIHDDAVGAPVDEVIAPAEEMLAQWADVLRVIPSLDLHVRMVPTIDGDSVIVSADQWRVLACLGGGLAADRVADRVGLHSFEAAHLIASLVEDGLVVVEDSPVARETESSEDAHAATDDQFAAGERGGALAGDVPRWDVDSHEAEPAADEDHWATDPIGDHVAIEAEPSFAEAGGDGLRGPETGDEFDLAIEAESDAGEIDALYELLASPADTTAVAEGTPSPAIESMVEPVEASAYDTHPHEGWTATDAGEAPAEDPAGRLEKSLFDAVAASISSIDWAGADASEHDVPPAEASADEVSSFVPEPVADDVPTPAASTFNPLEGLQHLSPKAAAAIEAMARAESGGAEAPVASADAGLALSPIDGLAGGDLAESAMAADDAGGDDGEGLNKNLLLKFLSSAKD